jgi:hypothetical protein
MVAVTVAIEVARAAEGVGGRRACRYVGADAVRSPPRRS